MYEKYIDPFTDFGFKRIFGQEANKDILIAFLNAILPSHHQIADLQFLNNELTPPRTDTYTAILDLHCVTPDGERFIVEMQQKNQAYFIDRSVYYIASAITNMIKRGTVPVVLPAVYFIGLMNFVHTGEGWQNALIREVSLKDRYGAEIYDKLRMLFIQMPLFNLTESQLELPRDKWLYFIKNLPDLYGIPEILGEPVFEKAFEIAATANMTEAEQLAYDASWKVKADNVAVWMKDREDFENARAKILAEGEAKGKAEGLAKGKAEGLAEGEAKGKADAVVLLAKKMKTSGMPLEQIATITGLPSEDIAKL